MARRRGGFVLTAPTVWLFALSCVLALLAILAGYARVSIPFISPAHILDTLVIAYLLLVAGVVFRQL